MPTRAKTATVPAERARVLASPARLEIVEAMRPDEECSVATLAERLNRPPQALYYHVRQLVEAGVIEAAGEQKSGPRTEILYRIRAQRVAVATNPASKTSLGLAEEVIAVTLRRATSEARRALRTGAVADLPSGAFIGRRMTGWLDDARLLRITRHLEAVERLLAEGRDRRIGRRVAFTVVLVPLVEGKTPPRR